MSLEFGKLDYAVSLRPLTAFPLDARSYFESYDLALAAAQKAREAGDTTTVYYYGQVLTVVENNVAKQYQIQPDNTLLEVGSGASADNETIENLQQSVSNLNTVVENLESSLESKADASALDAKANTADVEEALNSKANITDVEEALASKADASDLDSKANVDEVYTKTAMDEALASKADATDLSLKADADKVYTKDEADAKIASEIANADHLKREIVDNIDLYEADASLADKNVIYMVKAADSGDMYKEYMRFDLVDGTISFQQIGDTSADLSQYAKTADVETKLADYAKITDLAIYAKTEDINAKFEEVNTSNNDLAALIQANADAIALKADNVTVASLQEIVALKANSEDVYQKTEIDALFDNVYSKEEINNALASKVDESDFTLLQQAVSSNSQAINEKASAKDLTDLRVVVGNHQTSIDNIADSLNNYYQLKNSETDEYTLLSPTQAQLLNKLSFNEDGSVGISGTVSASNVTGLTDYINSWKDDNGIEIGAQVNKIEAIYTPDGNALAITAKAVTLPYATADIPGLVKLSNEFTTDSNNALTVNTININKIVQTEGEELLLDCGSAKSLSGPTATV